MEVITGIPSLSPRPADSNKGNFGRVLVIAGSRGMSGAGVLCGSAALRGGAGLVRVAVPRDILPLVAPANPCFMTAPMPCDDHGRFGAAAVPELLELADANDVVALGPGIGRSPELSNLVTTFLTRFKKSLVVDADGLNAIADTPDALKNHAGSVVVTPHPGEFARLIQGTVAQVQAQRQELAVRFAAENGVVVLLKGHGTIVTDGKRLYQNPTGNPGMATAGSGDVLTGLIAALLGQRLEPFAAAQLGAYIHGLAGDLARNELGEAGLIATDLIDRLPRARCQLS